jgi:iron complex outermembrane recepter protein
METLQRCEAKGHHTVFRKSNSRAPRGGALQLLLLSAAFVGLAAMRAEAQQPATLAGTVTGPSGEPIAAVHVFMEEAERGALTDNRGRFHIRGVPAGPDVLVARRIGYREERRSVSLRAGEAKRLDLVLSEAAVEMSGLVVSATREVRLKAETPAAVGVVSGQEIRDARPAHPADIAGQVAGVWVSAASGEGHFTAIRQPRTTKPMYLFLEDGVPTRSTGFFNHNALYEINVPQAERLEVLKGPATALYGSDAIGGVINVETRRASLQPQWESSAEWGNNGWTRLLLSGSGTRGDNGIRADLNVTQSDGHRDHTGYNRQSGTLRWDRYLPAGASLKTVATYSRVDQGDASQISRQDFLERPEANYSPISFRKVDAFRLSTQFDLPGEQSLLSITPFFRYNTMELLPTWMLSYDPVVYSTGHRSYGGLVKYRRDVAALRTQLIGGADVEYSPGQRREHRIQPVRESGVFTRYTDGEVVYDYDVAFRGVSPYLQAEIAPTEQLRLSAGLRFDRVGYDYQTQLAPTATGMHRRPESTAVRYDHLSPKLGMTYRFAPAANVFASYRHGFRAPSEGQLFRQGSSETGVGLKPVQADNYELGLRGDLGRRLNYEASVYRMDISDDILTYITRTDGVVNRVNTNAGATRHEGVEVGLGLELTRQLRLDASYSNALHRYRDWAPSTTEGFGGKRMEAAPRELINARMTYSPAALSDARFGAEWVRVGRYYMDAANTHEYAGHNLFNLRLTLPVSGGLELAGRVNNLLDTRYAEGASFNAFQGEEFSPGRPRTVSLGAQYRWQR